MARRGVVTGVLACALGAIAFATPGALGAGGGAYKPVHVSTDWTYSALYSDNGGCGAYAPAVLDPRTAAADSALAIRFSGIEKPSSADYGQTVTYDLRGTIGGKITDAAGATFDVSGMFFDRTTATNRGDLRFDGTGRVTLTGPAGTVTGDASLRLVTAPNEVQLHFTSIRACSTG